MLYFAAKVKKISYTAKYDILNSAEYNHLTNFGKICLQNNDSYNFLTRPYYCVFFLYSSGVVPMDLRNRRMK